MAGTGKAAARKPPVRKAVRKRVRKAVPAKAAVAVKAAGPKIATWSATIQTRFLEELAETANVAQSALTAGTSDKRVYKRRQSDAKFRTAFQRALAEGYLRLELKMLERALARAGGKTTALETKPDAEDKAVAPIRADEERIWLQLLRQHRAAVQATDIFEEIEDLVVVRRRIEEKLAEMNRRLAAVDAGGPG